MNCAEVMLSMNWKTIFKTISRILTTLLFIALLLSLIIVLSTRASGGDPNLFGYQLKTVLSGSMEPDIKTGSIIAIKTGDDMARFKKDDIITFRTTDDLLVTHRIIEVIETGQQYVTKGDANNVADLNPVLSEEIVGKYTGFTIPFVGYAMTFANSKEGAALLLFLPGIFFILYAFITFRQIGRELEASKNAVSENVD